MKRKYHISLIIIMLSLALFSSYHIYYYFLDKGSDNLQEVYYDNHKPEVILTKVDNDYEEYLGILRIPKINLKEGFYSINSKNNNINKSVTILKESKLDIHNGSIIYLVAHSGTGYKAFFKDLDKLNINDILYLDINGNYYEYIINDKYELDKNGKITVSHNIHDDYLVLSTCSKNKEKQLVIVSKLIS